METNTSRWVQLDPDHIVDRIPLDLEHAGAGRNVAWHLSGCFDSVRKWSGKPVLPAAIRDELLRLTVRAEMAAHDAFPKHFEREIHCGMQALAATFSMWALAHDERLALKSSQSADVQDRRRILQNVCHNLCLQVNIEERAYARRAEEIEALIGRSVRQQGGAA